MMSELKENRIQVLKDLINSNPDPRELKRALAVKLAFLWLCLPVVDRNHNRPEPQSSFF